MEFENLISYLFRWIHFFAGVAWIGLLYYFNFVQTEYFKETDAAAKSSAISKLVPRALWWFRWGAMLTFLSGLALAGYMASAINYYIVVGMLLGTLMFLNVWLIIWPNQHFKNTFSFEGRCYHSPLRLVPRSNKGLCRAAKIFGNSYSPNVIFLRKIATKFLQILPKTQC